MSGGGKSVCKGRMGASIATAVDTKDFANNETKLQKVCVKMWLFLCCVVSNGLKSPIYYLLFFLLNE